MAESHKRAQRSAVFLSKRPRSSPDRLLPVKLATLVVGVVLGLAGMRTGSSLLVSLAIGVVLVGVFLRFLRHGKTD